MSFLRKNTGIFLHAYFLTLVIAVFGKPNQDVHNITYTSLGSTKTVCLKAINYDICGQQAGMKFSFHEEYSADNDVGILLYNILIDPDKHVTRKRTTKYGFRNVTHERNSTHICLLLIEMNALADGKVFTVDEMCGFGHAQLHSEARHWLMITRLFPTTQSSMKKITGTSVSATKTSMTTITSTPAFVFNNTKSIPGGNGRKVKQSSAGAIAGIIVAIMIVLVLIGLAAYCYQNSARVKNWFVRKGFKINTE